MLLANSICFSCVSMPVGSGTTSRLKQLGMEFTVWVFKHVCSRLKSYIGM